MIVTYLLFFFLFLQDSPEYDSENDHGSLEDLGQRMEEVWEENGIEGVHPSQWISLF